MERLCPLGHAAAPGASIRGTNGGSGQYVVSAATRPGKVRRRIAPGRRAAGLGDSGEVNRTGAARPPLQTTHRARPRTDRRAHRFAWHDTTPGACGSASFPAAGQGGWVEDGAGGDGKRFSPSAAARQRSAERAGGAAALRSALACIAGISPADRRFRRRQCRSRRRRRVVRAIAPREIRRNPLTVIKAKPGSEQEKATIVCASLPEAIATSQTVDVEYHGRQRRHPDETENDPHRLR